MYKDTELSGIYKKSVYRAQTNNRHIEKIKEKFNVECVLRRLSNGDNILWIAPKGTKFQNSAEFQEFKKNASFGFSWNEMVVRYGSEEWYAEFELAYKNWKEENEK